MNSPTPAADLVRESLRKQMRAALAMLRESIELCPETLWTDSRYLSQCWQVAYHALFFAHCYSAESADAFERWPEHRADCQYDDGIPGTGGSGE